MSGFPLSNKRVTGGDMTIMNKNKCELGVFGEIKTIKKKLAKENKKTQRNAF